MNAHVDVNTNVDVDTYVNVHVHLSHVHAYTCIMAARTLYGAGQKKLASASSGSHPWGCK